jgi:hypothetical protein
MLKTIVNLFAPKKIQDLFIKLQGYVNGGKTYIGIALIFVNQVVAPILLALAGMLDQIAALQGVGAFVVYLQGITANQYWLKIGEALMAVGIVHKADKIIVAASTPDADKVIPFVTPLCDTVLPEAVKPEVK